jgi:hypothetical protein
VWHAALWLGLQLYGWASLGKVGADNSRLSISKSTPSGTVGPDLAVHGMEGCGNARADNSR